jgi:ketosteroid isomerase-like protein
LAQAVDALARFDVDASIGIVAPDAVWEVRALGLSLTGTEAIREFIEDWRRSYEDFTNEIAESRVLGGGVTLIVIRQTGRLKGGGGELHQELAWVMTWADGLIVRIDGYQDIDQARAAAERLAQERG